MNTTLLQAEKVWPPVAKILYVPHDDAEYDRLVEVLDQLIDRVGEDETHPLAATHISIFSAALLLCRSA